MGTTGKRKYTRSGNFSKASHSKMHGEHGSPIIMNGNTPMKKDARELNLPVDTMLMLITNAEKAIANNVVLKAAIQPVWDEKKGFLDLAKADFDEVDTKVKAIDKDSEDQEKVINGFRDFLGIKKKKVVTGTTISDEKKDKKQRKAAGKRVDWLASFTETLEVADKFLTFEEMFRRRLADKVWVEESGKTEARLWALKTAVEINMHTHADRFGKNTSGNWKQYLVVYNGKFGLAEWVDKKGNLINPKHLKEVMGVYTKKAEVAN